MIELYEVPEQVFNDAELMHPITLEDWIEQTPLFTEPAREKKPITGLVVSKKADSGKYFITLQSVEFV